MMHLHTDIVEKLREECINQSLNYDTATYAINEILFLRNEVQHMKELLRECGIKYPPQQPALLTKTFNTHT